MEIENSILNTAMIEHEFDFIGGNLCLDFANTVGGLPPDSPSQERLISYLHLLTWCQQANLISMSEAYHLLDKVARAPAEATTILERAHAIREAIYGIFAAVALHTPTSESDLELFNRELETGMAGARVMLTPAGFGWEWHKDADALDQMLAPIVRAAAMLLTSAERPFVRQCANEACRWLFIDTTKNHSRQWCRTKGCGNMMRVRKHRERQRSKDDSA